MGVKHLCVNCSWFDIKSADKWDKACKIVEDIATIEQAAGMDPGPFPTFDIWKPHCTHSEHKRQPVTDAVAGTHLDGPPYLTCREARKNYPVTCPFFEERKNADNDLES